MYHYCFHTVTKEENKRTENRRKKSMAELRENRSFGMTAKDIFNASAGSVKVVFGLPIIVSGFAISQSIDRETGEMRNVGYIADTEGNVYGFVSAVCIENLEMLFDYALKVYGSEENYKNSDEPIVIEFKKDKSKSDREFSSFIIK